MSRSRRFLFGISTGSCSGTALLLLVVGVVMVYSASQVPSSPASISLWRQQSSGPRSASSWGQVITAVPYRVFEEYGHFLYGFGLLLLVLVGDRDRGSTKRWLSIGGFSFQPSEPAKIFTFIMVARYLSNRRIDVQRPPASRGSWRSSPAPELVLFCSLVLAGVALRHAVPGRACRF